MQHTDYQTHFPGEYEHKSNMTFLYWSIEPPKRLIIFVHGFTGSAIKTWHQFPQLISGEQKLKNTDVFFYDYRSTRLDPVQHAMNFLDFFNLLKDSQEETYPRELGEMLRDCRQHIKYEEIIIVAHSLGAIISRYALLLEKKERSLEFDKLVKFVFFAPAHNGARASTSALLLYFSEFLGVASFMMPFASYKIPMIEELQVGSPALSFITNETRSLLAINENSYVKAVMVRIAENELIVHNDPFCSDPVPKAYPGKHHSNVCKPNNEFRDPFNDLLLTFADV